MVTRSSPYDDDTSMRAQFFRLDALVMLTQVKLVFESFVVEDESLIENI